MNPEDPRAAFERYEEEHQGEPVDPAIAEEAERELLLDKLHDRAGREQPEREAVMAGMPEGKLFEIDLADEKIPEAITALAAAKKTLIESLNSASGSELLGDPRNTTFAALEKARDTKDGGATLSEGLGNAVEAMRTYMTIDPETTLYDIPELMGEFLSRLQRRHHHLGKNAGGDSGENDLHRNHNYE